MAFDLSNLKEQVQTILEAANTTTATADLSSGMSSRVQGVFKIHPERIPIQASLYPCVSMYVETKDTEQMTIAKDQLTAKRRGLVNLKVVGEVWNSAFTTVDVDSADNDCEDLMENIEQVLRANPTLNDTCLWAIPTDVKYYSLNAEETHMRAGILNLKCTVDY